MIIWFICQLYYISSQIIIFLPLIDLFHFIFFTCLFSIILIIFTFILISNSFLHFIYCLFVVSFLFYFVVSFLFYFVINFVSVSHSFNLCFYLIIHFLNKLMPFLIIIESLYFLSLIFTFCILKFIHLVF